MQRGAAGDESEGDGTRTRNLRIDSPVQESVTHFETSNCDSTISNDNNRRNNGLQGEHLNALAAVLAALPTSERAAVIAHVAALANLSPEKRAALMTLAT